MGQITLVEILQIISRNLGDSILTVVLKYMFVSGYYNRWPNAKWNHVYSMCRSIDIFVFSLQLTWFKTLNTLPLFFLIFKGTNYNEVMATIHFKRWGHSSFFLSSQNSKRMFSSELNDVLYFPQDWIYLDVYSTLLYK